jgi:hypothetical protein
VEEVEQGLQVAHTIQVEQMVVQEETVLHLQLQGSSVTYAGGGGGGVYQSGSGGNGGSGGGAASRGSGSPNTGGGGGGANMITREDRFGGSGIVVIRVPSTVPLTSSGGTPSTAPNGDKIVTFNGSGTYTVG